MEGWLTSKWYQYVCVLADHFSDFTICIYLQPKMIKSSKQKWAFEATADAQGIRVKHYHADNGILAAKQWMTSCRDQNQGLSRAVLIHIIKMEEPSERYNPCRS
jgi:hypothetical protein